MSKEISISSWCDACAVDGERVAAQDDKGVLLQAGRDGLPVEVDLCTAHLEWLDKLTRRGRAPEAVTPKTSKTSSPGAMTCPLCRRAYRGRNGLNMHLARAHGTPSEERVRLLAEAPAA